MGFGVQGDYLGVNSGRSLHRCREGPSSTPSPTATTVGRHASPPQTAVERVWHIQDSQGQILALAFRRNSLNFFVVISSLGSKLCVSRAERNRREGPPTRTRFAWASGVGLCICAPVIPAQTQLQWRCIHCRHISSHECFSPPRKVGSRLHEEGESNSHGARPVY